MLDHLLTVIREEHLAEQLYHSLVGLEIEEHRIDQHGRLSQRPHPRQLGSRTDSSVLTNGLYRKPVRGDY